MPARSTVRRRFGVAGVAALVAFFASFGIRSSDPAPGIGVANPTTFEAAYERWQARYARLGGDETLFLALGYDKGLSAEFTRARGGLALDLRTGSLSVDVQGLPDDQSFDLWLVDNRPGPGRSVKPEAGDAMFQIGTLQSADGVGRLHTELALDALRGFQIHLAVLAPSGESVSEKGLLFGSPSLFQRIYHGARSENLAGYVDRASDPDEGGALAAAFEFLVPRVAHAQPGGLSLEELIAFGEVLFFEETFGGNGRTCGTCHPAENNFTIDPMFIATLPDDDPLFVHENDPALAQLEHGQMLRQLGLVLENLDGFENPGVMRGTPHILALGTSMAPAPNGEDGLPLPSEAPMDRLGWSGDGSPNDGTLRDFATGAVRQHFPKTLARVPGVDFRFPNTLELDAMAAFQLSVGRASDPDLTSIVMKSPIAEEGRVLFLREDSDEGPAAKCNTCHFMAGATVSDLANDAHGIASGRYNFNLDIGVQEMEDPMADLIDATANPPDAGFGQAPHPDGGFGDNTFNVPTLIEAADTGPYFHNHTIFTLEGITAFYLGGEFNASPAANAFLRVVDDPPGFGALTVDDTHLTAVAVFLRVLNSLENIRSAIAYIDRQPIRDSTTRLRVHRSAIAELEDAQQVLTEVGAHPDAIALLERAEQFVRDSRQGRRSRRLSRAVDAAEDARDLMVE